MATKKITTSFTVAFSTPDAEKDGILIAEVDDRPPEEGGLNPTTSFTPGMDVIYLIYCGPGVSVDKQIHSWGSHVDHSSPVIVDQEEDVTFFSPDQLEQSLKYPVKSITSIDVVGISGVGAPVIKGNTLTAGKSGGDGYGVGIYKIKYKTSGSAYVLKHAPLGFPEYEIATLVVGDFTPPV